MTTRTTDVILQEFAPRFVPLLWTMTMIGYYPEMHEKRPDGSQIEARLGHYGRHWYISTPLVLKGRGIRHLRTMTPEMLPPAGQRRAGWHEYEVTERAMGKLEAEYVVTTEMLL